jgi:hypothetical protein
MGRFALDSSETKLPISGEKGKVIISKMPSALRLRACRTLYQAPAVI